MNIKLTLIIFLIAFQYSFSQKTFNTKSDPKTNIYLHALEKYLDTIDKDIPEKHKEYYIEKKHIYLDSFPKSINGFKINWVKKVDLVEILESKKTDFITISIKPVSIKDDKFYVHITPFYAHSKHKLYTVWNKPYTSYYEFDCEQNGLVFKKLAELEIEKVINAKKFRP